MIDLLAIAIFVAISGPAVSWGFVRATRLGSEVAARRWVAAAERDEPVELGGRTFRVFEVLDDELGDDAVDLGAGPVPADEPSTIDMGPPFSRPRPER